MTEQKQPFRLFTNPVLNYFSTSYYLSVVAVYLPTILLLLFLAKNHDSTGMLIILFLLGNIIWVFSEYFIHRFVFHYKPKDSKWELINPAYHLMISHQLHHTHPKDLGAVMPLVMSIPLYCLIYLLFRCVFSEHGYVLLSGFMSGYLLYETVHCSTHSIPIPTRVGKFLKYYHMRHHYFESTKCFGVTSPFLDYVFKTYAEGRKPARNHVEEQPGK